MADKNQSRIFITNKADTKECKLGVLQQCFNTELQC